MLVTLKNKNRAPSIVLVEQCCVAQKSKVDLRINLLGLKCGLVQSGESYLKLSVAVHGGPQLLEQTTNRLQK